MKKNEKIVAQLTDVFRQYGYHGTTLSIISQETGLGRSSIYHHFPGGKDAMALAAIDYVEETFSRDVFEPLRLSDGDARAMAEVKEYLWAFYNDGNGGCLLTAFGSVNAPRPIRQRVSAIFDAWIVALAAYYEQAETGWDDKRTVAGVRIAGIQGALIMSSVMSDKKRLRGAIDLLG